VMAIFDAAPVSTAEVLAYHREQRERLRPVTVWTVFSAGLVLGWLLAWLVVFPVARYIGASTCPEFTPIEPVRFAQVGAP